MMKLSHHVRNELETGESINEREKQSVTKQESKQELILNIIVKAT